MNPRCLLALLLTPLAVTAQGDLGHAATRPDSAATASDRWYAERDAVRALAAADDGLRHRPDDYDLLWRAARAHVALGVLEADRSVIDGHHREATRQARRAVMLEPDRPDAHLWLAAVLGRGAQRAGFREAITLGAEAWREATRALEIDSTTAMASAIQGRLLEAVARFPWFVRAMIATFSGFTMARGATFEAAEQHYQRAIRFDSLSVAPQVDLARLALRRGRLTDPQQVMQRLRALPARTPIDDWLRDDLEKQLARKVTAR